jgi:hypothetical protein
MKKEIEAWVHSARPHFGPGRTPSVRPFPVAQATWPAQSARHARCARPRDYRGWPGHGGAVGPGSLVDKVWWGRQCKHRGKLGHAPDKEEAAAAHPSGVAAGRCKGGGSTVVSRGGGGIPVIVICG